MDDYFDTKQCQRGASPLTTQILKKGKVNYESNSFNATITNVRAKTT